MGAQQESTIVRGRHGGKTTRDTIVETKQI